MPLSPREIAKLTGQATSEQLTTIDTIIEQCLDKAKARYPDVKLIKPVVNFELRGTTAGRCSKHGKLIQLNIDLLHSEHYPTLIDQTLPHEMAHAIQFQLWPESKPHGQEWQYIMYLLGKPANRTHNMPVTKARVHKKKHVYHCSANCPENPHYVTTLIHNRIQNSNRRYHCTHCKGNLTYVRNPTD